MASLNSLRVRDLIRAVRQCKSPSEEQALVNRERAIIRESMKDGSPYNRTRNMLKLMYLSMIGYSTSFGQLEVVNLLAQRDFSGKRTGYLSLPIMVDEKDEVLTLVENHMKADMSGDNVLLRAVALNAAANIASEDMARDILEDVMKLVKNYNPYIRKKACLCALRMVKKVPEFAEYFLTEMDSMFTERFGGSLLCSLALVNYCLQTPQGQSFLPQYRSLVTVAIRTLQALVTTTRICDATIGMITDPFLQIKLLEFMRIIGKDNVETSDVLHDCLASVMSQTVGDKNVSHSVRYECARTIQAIQSDPQLRLLGINVMGRMLETKCNNFRYVALECLSQYAAVDPTALQVHQNIILDSIKEPDPSIQLKSLDLIVEVINEHNVRLLVPDLLDFLRLSTGDIKENVALHLCRVVENKSPSDEWRIDVSIKILKAGRKFVPLGFASRFIALISRQPADVQLRAVSALWEELAQGIDAVAQQREALMLSAVWSVGELVVPLLSGKAALTAEKVAQCIVDVTMSTVSKKVKLYGLTALMKIASRCPDAAPLVIKSFSYMISSLDCEVQQRASEYTTLLTTFKTEAAFCYGPMPPIAVAEETAPAPIAVVASLPQEVKQADLDKILDDLFGEGSPASSPSPTEQHSPSSVHQDPLGDLFGNGNPSSPAAGAQSSPLAGSPIHSSPPLSFIPIKEYEDLSVALAASQSQNVISAKVKMISKLSLPMEGLVFQAAVPKTATIALGVLPSTVIPPGGELVQQAEVTISSAAKNPRALMLRIRVIYSVAGEKREQLVEISHQV